MCDPKFPVSLGLCAISNAKDRNLPTKCAETLGTIYRGRFILEDLHYGVNSENYTFSFPTFPYQSLSPFCCVSLSAIGSVSSKMQYSSGFSNWHCGCAYLSRDNAQCCCSINCSDSSHIPTFAASGNTIQIDKPVRSLNEIFPTPALAAIKSNRKFLF